MSKRHIVIGAIERDKAHSPNMTGADAAIFSATLDHLRDAGCEVRLFDEDTFIRRETEERCLVNMCREYLSVLKLQDLERKGCRVVNSGFGIENCGREKMTRLLLTGGVPHPESVIISASTREIYFGQVTGFYPCWLKRADKGTLCKEDVCYVETEGEFSEALKNYESRGIARVVVNRHLKGDLIKFYGVSGTPFFRWFYPEDYNHSKFGYEAVNGRVTGIPFSVAGLKQICGEAARILGVEVYGGDCVVSPDGTVRIIDFNDWPSFSMCRDEASFHISSRIMDVFALSGKNICALKTEL